MTLSVCASVIGLHPDAELPDRHDGLLLFVVCGGAAELEELRRQGLRQSQRVSGDYVVQIGRLCHGVVRFVVVACIGVWGG